MKIQSNVAAGRCWSRWLLVWLLVVSSDCLQAESILDLTFDDPRALVSGTPDGLSTLDAAMARGSVASGKGGKAAPLFTGDLVASQQKVQVLKEPPMGTAAFVRFILQGASKAKTAGMGITPDSPEHSLGALCRYENGMVFMDGGFDFFFRIEQGNLDLAPKMAVWCKSGLLNIQIEMDVERQNGLSAKISADPGVIQDLPEKKRDLGTRNVTATAIECGVLYHVAVVFTTPADGAINMRVFLQAGKEAINVADGEPVNAEISHFTMLAKVAPSPKAERVTIVLGQREFAQTLDLAAFRIYKPAPDVFPALP